jgi:hypothetical protein
MYITPPRAVKTYIIAARAVKSSLLVRNAWDKCNIQGESEGTAETS